MIVMKILHVVNISFVIPFFLGKQLAYFSSKGYKEYVVCSPSNELEEFSRNYEFENHPIDILRKFSLISDFKAIYHVYCLIKREKMDVVNGHTPKGALIAMIASFLARVPKRIYFRHGLVYETSTGTKRYILKCIDKFTASLATKVVCVSPSLAKLSLEERLNPEYKQTILANGSCNGIDVNQFSEKTIDSNVLGAIKKELSISDEDFLIGFTGRLVRDKGIIELVNAFKQLQKRHHNLKLLLVGMFEERDAIPEDVIHMIERDPHIINIGYVDNRRIPYYYLLMDVFIFPSHREGFGMSVIEASAMEVPVIASRITGCVDSIIENKTGLFIGKGEEEIFAAVEKLYWNPELRQSLGKEGRQFVIHKFDQHLVWEDIEKLYMS